MSKKEDRAQRLKVDLTLLVWEAEPRLSIYMS